MAIKVENERIAQLDFDDLVTFLQSRAMDYHCAKYIYHLNGVERIQLYQELEIERIDRKYFDIKRQYDYVGSDWNQTMFIMIMRMLSDKHNRANFMEMAYRVHYSTLIAEGDCLENIEAMLIVASGLIGQLPIDDFTTKIRKLGEHLLRKHSITPLVSRQWRVNGQLVTRAPILRLAQMAQLIYRNDMLFNSVISCRKREDILTLFNVEARSEWLKYFGSARSARIGVQKCDIFGINVVIPLLYVFGHATFSDELTDAASELNETIPAESNHFITSWRNQGLNPTVTYEAQALIQLASEYCRLSEQDLKMRRMGEDVSSRCEECPLLKHLCSRASAIDRVPIFLDGCERP